MRVLTEALIRSSEENAVNSGAFSFHELMYRAGKSAADIIMSRFPSAAKKSPFFAEKATTAATAL